MFAAIEAMESDSASGPEATGLSIRRRRSFEGRPGGGRIGLQHGQEPAQELGPGLRLRVAAAGREELVQPPDALAWWRA